MKVLCVKKFEGLLFFATGLIVACLAQGCASPTGKLKNFANEQGFTRSEIRTEGYNLLVFDNKAVVGQPEQTENLSRKSVAAGNVLRVYLEGDGSPWRHRTIIMPDPTPRSPLMLRLMSLDLNLAVYVGRPCYNGTSNEPPCHNGLWTSGRYSEVVVQSMVSAIRALAMRHKADELWLFGHSGGGALAMLIAPQVAAVTRVVTIAGNLDTDAWTEHHNYSRLYSSGNPAKLPALRDSIQQWHFLGANDQVIPPALVKNAIARQASARSFLLPSFSHGCCWAKIWPSVLDALKEDNPSRAPGRKVSLQATPTTLLDNR
jgi:hypothetical protein